mgnify:CR=1 FL=1
MAGDEIKVAHSSTIITKKEAMQIVRNNRFKINGGNIRFTDLKGNPVAITSII